MKRFLQTMLVALVAMVVPITTWAQESSAVEAKWGASVDALTGEGTLAEAVAAAGSNPDVRYIQVQGDISLTNGTCAANSGKFLLDLNGCTLSGKIVVRAAGTEVTLTDTKGGGEVLPVDNYSPAVLVSHEGAVIIEGGYYEGQYAVTTEDNSSATISGGTYKASLAAIKSLGATTVTGGTFEGDYSRGVIEYHRDKFDLSGYPVADNGTDTPITDITVFNCAEGLVVSESTIALPTGHSFYNRNNEAVTELVPGVTYTIGVGDVTGIDAVFGDAAAVAQSIYDLQGRRLEEISEPGIYIINGKKKLVK